MKKKKILIIIVAVIAVLAIVIGFALNRKSDTAPQADTDSTKGVSATEESEDSEEGQDQATASDGTPEPSQEMEVVDESVPADSGSYGELFGDEDGSSGEGASEDELDWSELQE